MRALDTGETVAHYLDTSTNRAQIAGRLRRTGTCSREGACVLRKSLSAGPPASRQMFHVKRSDKRSLDPCQSVRGDCVAHFVRHVLCIVPMRKRSNRADTTMKVELQRWLNESGESEELMAFMREERARHPVPPPRVAVTTKIDEAVAVPRVIDNEWGAECATKIGIPP